MFTINVVRFLISYYLIIVLYCYDKIVTDTCMRNSREIDDLYVISAYCRL